MGTDARSRLTVLHVTPEMTPVSKVGGLADVAGSLPGALQRLGVDARVFTPSWPGVAERLRDLGARAISGPDRICVPFGGRKVCSDFSVVDLAGTSLCLLEDDELFSNPSIYPEKLDPLSAMPFAFLSLAAVEYSLSNEWKPQILHLHDWPSSLVPAALKWHRVYGVAREGPRTVLTIHNIAHQGILPLSALDEWGFGPEALTLDGVEFYGSANLLKGGITASDAVVTVSPNYAREILSPEFGEGLEGVLEYRKSKITGILNGIDTASWDPWRDKAIPANFRTGDMKGKQTCRAVLLSECGWVGFSGPLIVSVGRLVRQKGLELLLHALDEILSMGARLVLIGTGERELEERFSREAIRRQDGLHFRRAFDEGFARLAYAGGDIFIMPSLFEPCGLSQMISMRYGTVPVARGVGGLVDTVSDADAGPRGTGFLFDDFTPEALMCAVKRALTHFSEPRSWSQLRKRCMEKDFSWDLSARSYMTLYSSLSDQ
ncbi:MAG TPA: glycogen synthase [Synergistales bacterium]|mgnify:FL=1|nr:glycogen synthase [Synergistales bacterium]MDI9393069.1 glycogen synthase [Synergistota bacterium]MDY0179119.1 glycogen synthase [Synergistaceae bacterium]HRV70798.1 glycogen synthase [Thermovirgaceae bacterium]MDD5514947.1 glycogen synthase [Synergistales bacterium]